MSDRRRGNYPRDADGLSLIDAGALMMTLQLTTTKQLRDWVAKHGLVPVKRGAHGAWMYRWRDVAEVLDNEAEDGLES